MDERKPYVEYSELEKALKMNDFGLDSATRAVWINYVGEVKGGIEKKIDKGKLFANSLGSTIWGVAFFAWTFQKLGGYSILGSLMVSTFGYILYSSLFNGGLLPKKTIEDNRKVRLDPEEWEVGEGYKARDIAKQLEEKLENTI